MLTWVMSEKHYSLENSLKENEENLDKIINLLAE